MWSRESGLWRTDDLFFSRIPSAGAAHSAQAPLWAGLTGHEKVGVWLLTCRTAYYCNEYISTSLISTFQVLHQHISTFAHFKEHFSTSAHQRILVSSLAHQYCVDYEHTMPFVDAMSTSTVLTDSTTRYHEHINII